MSGSPFIGTAFFFIGVPIIVLYPISPTLAVWNYWAIASKWQFKEALFPLPS